MTNWQKVYQDNLQHRAEIVRAVLEDNEIPAFVVSKKDSAYQFGHFEVHVDRDDVMKGKKIIEDDIRFE